MKKPPVGPVIRVVGDHSCFLTHRGWGRELYGFNSFVDPSKGIFTTDSLTGYERNVCYSPYAARVTVAICPVPLHFVVGSIALVLEIAMILPSFVPSMQNLRYGFSRRLVLSAVGAHRADSARDTSERHN